MDDDIELLRGLDVMGLIVMVNIEMVDGLYTFITATTPVVQRGNRSLFHSTSQITAPFAQIHLELAVPFIRVI